MINGNPEVRKPVSERWDRIKSKNENLKHEISDLVARDAEIRHKKFVFFYDEGIKFLNRGIYKDAIKSFEMALKMDRRHKRAQRYLIEAILRDMEPNGHTEPKPTGKPKPKANPKPIPSPKPRASPKATPKPSPKPNSRPKSNPMPSTKPVSDGAITPKPSVSKKPRGPDQTNNDRNIAMIFNENYKIVQKRRAAALERELKNAGLLDNEDLDSSFSAKIPNGHGMDSEPNGSVVNKKNVAADCS